MKLAFFAIILIITPLVLISAAACPDCPPDIDLTDKKSVISCIVTVIFGLIIRHIERKQLRKNNEEHRSNE